MLCFRDSQHQAQVCLCVSPSCSDSRVLPFPMSQLHSLKWLLQQVRITASWNPRLSQCYFKRKCLFPPLSCLKDPRKGLSWLRWGPGPTQQPQVRGQQFPFRTRAWGRGWGGQRSAALKEVMCAGNTHLAAGNRGEPGKTIELMTDTGGELHLLAFPQGGELAESVQAENTFLQRTERRAPGNS